MRLKEARASKFLTMAKLAENAGVSVYTIRNIEADKSVPTLSVAVKIAGALGIDPAEIDEFRASRDMAAKGRVSRQKAQKAS